LLNTRRSLKTLRWVVLLMFARMGFAGPVLERGNGPEPDSLDPARAQGLSAHQVLRDLYEGLFVEDSDGVVVPGVALSWVVDSTKLHWTFELDPTSVYADGRAVLAQDFVYAFNRALDPANAAPYAAALLPIAGATERLAGKPTPLQVHALGPHRLKLSLVQPSVDLPARLSLPIAYPVDFAQFESGVAAGRKVINGNGPYRLVDWKPGAWIELEANPHHPQVQRLAIDRVRFHVTEDAATEARRFEAGELHLTETVPPQSVHRLRARYGDQLKIGPALGTFFLGYNLRRPPFADQPQLREALSLALDRDLLVRLVTGTGERPTHALLPPELGGQTGEKPTSTERLARARKLYRAAGYSASNPLQLELRFNTSSLNRRLMLAVSAMWQEQLGVETRLRNEDWKVFVRNRRAGLITEVFRGGWNADFADALNFLEPFSSQSSMNMTGYADRVFDDLLTAASRAPTQHTRQDLLQKAHDRLLSAHAIIPIFQYTTKHLVSDRVVGFKANPLDHHPTRYLRWRTDSAK
jgi:oligopeptide transport system substrate-binding protein